MSSAPWEPNYQSYYLKWWNKSQAIHLEQGDFHPRVKNQERLSSSREPQVSLGRLASKMLSSGRKENTKLKGYTHPIVHSSTIYNSQDMEAT